MKILVTGGTGFLGSHLVPLLQKAGHHVRVIGRSAEPVEWSKHENRVEYVQSDLNDRDAVRTALIDREIVFHLAGLVSFKNVDARKMYALHVDCTRELLRDIRELGTKPRVILASTSGTIAVSAEERVATEADDYPIHTVGHWPYYLSKIYEEKLALEFCKKHDIPLVVLNPALLMGPGDTRLSSTWTVAKFLQRDIPAMPGGGMCFVDARDAAQAFYNAMTMGELYGRHLLGVNLTMNEFFGKLSRLTGISAPRIKLSKRMNIFGAYALEHIATWRGLEPKLDPQEVEVGEHWFWCDASKATRLLNFEARDTYETLHDTVHDTLSRLPLSRIEGLKGQVLEGFNQ